MLRQKNLKVLAVEADARWAAKPSFLDSPGKARGQPLPAMEVKDPGGYAKATEPPEKEGVRSAVGGGLKDHVQGTDTKVEDAIDGKEKGKMQVPDGIRHRFNERPEKTSTETKEEKKEKEDPWKRARGGPSEDWQPKPWNGNIAATRR